MKECKINLYYTMEYFPKIEYKFSDICCKEMLVKLQNDIIEVSFPEKEFKITIKQLMERDISIKILYCPFCGAKLKLLETNSKNVI